VFLKEVSVARINNLGNIIASCHGCKGSTSTFEYMYNGSEIGFVTNKTEDTYGRGFQDTDLQYRLFRCAGCGTGGLGCIQMIREGASYPNEIRHLIWFMPESNQRLSLPKDTQKGISNEFREGEKCIEKGCLRAAAGMFRSVLDKTLRANGYKKSKVNLAQQIDEAAKDGVITESRRRRAHDEIRVLGNDVLHDEWHPIPAEDVEAARHYCQRILEDFYDDRNSVLKLLREAGRVPDEDKVPEQKE
jgi:hypothetical protein